MTADCRHTVQTVQRSLITCRWANLRHWTNVQTCNSRTNDSLRNIDVIWFRESGKQFYPHSAFEVELSTGIWSGVGRLTALREYSTGLFVVSNEHNRFEQVMQSQPELQSRVKNIATDHVGVLYSAETRLRDLRREIGI
jgi:hypothetical protein